MDATRKHERTRRKDLDMKTTMEHLWIRKAKKTAEYPNPQNSTLAEQEQYDEYHPTNNKTPTLMKMKEKLQHK